MKHEPLSPSQQRVEQIISQVKQILDDHLNAGNYKLYLFGSRTKALNTEGADIDLAISSSTLRENQFRKIRRQIAELRTLYSIDLIHLESVEDDFRQLILRSAREINE